MVQCSLYTYLYNDNARTPTRTVQKTLGHNNRKEIGEKKSLLSRRGRRPGETVIIYISDLFFFYSCSLSTDIIYRGRVCAKSG